MVHSSLLRNNFAEAFLGRETFDDSILCKFEKLIRQFSSMLEKFVKIYIKTFRQFYVILKENISDRFPGNSTNYLRAFSRSR